MRRMRILLPALAWWMLAVVGIGQASAGAASTLQGRTMGTTWTVKLASADAPHADALQKGIQAQLDRVDGQMSTWKPDSALSRFNRAPAGTWQHLPDAFFRVLAHALDVARDSGGAYDPTVGPLVDLWGFGPQQRPHRPPTAQAIAAARKHVGWERIKLNAARHEALQPGGMHIDLSAVAKGFGVDEVARWLLAQDVQDFLVEVGGELRAHGRKADGRPWHVAVERPGAAAGGVQRRDQVGHVLALHDRAIATSGDYRHYFEDADRYYSHHIDPRNGRPVTHGVASVTVVADTAMQADPMGTTLSVLGPQAGMTFARRRGLAVLMITRGEHGLEEHMSPAFEALLQP